RKNKATMLRGSNSSGPLKKITSALLLHAFLPQPPNATLVPPQRRKEKNREKEQNNEEKADFKFFCDTHGIYIWFKFKKLRKGKISKQLAKQSIWIRPIQAK
ncbi:hypothetical protein TorRG33x02_172190, partial [Trema orientale]